MRGLVDGGAVLHLIFGAFLISFSPVFARLAGSATTSTGFYRMLFGLCGLAVMILLGGKVRNFTLKGFAAVAFSGFFFSLDIYFWHKSIVLVGPGLSTLLANFQVFFLAALDVFIFRQRISLRLLMAVVLAFAGLYLLVGTGWAESDEVFRLGVIYGLLTAMMYSGYLLTLRLAGTLKVPMDKRSSMVVVTAVSCVVLGVMAFLSGESLRIPDMVTGVYLVLYGLLCQALGWVVIASALPRTKLTVGGLILLLQPTLAYVWDITIFNKTITSPELAGAVLALSAIYLGTVRKS